MSKLPEITDLFARLASNLQTENPNEDHNQDLLISNLNKSLNLGENRVRVLDTALSLMCFTAPQVFDSVVEYLVKTIVAVLSSTINFKVLRFGKDEVLLIGSSVLSYDCREVIEACADVLGKLEGFCHDEGRLSSSLLFAVIRVAASATRFHNLLQLTPVLDVNSIDGRTPALSKLLCHMPKEFSFKSHEIPLRLLFWYLDPLILKNDISQILQVSTRRPFLCLNVELYERNEWRYIIICLVLSPAMFIETRALLHNWFLATGLASVLELQIELASLVLDVISRPMWWGISAELGSKLPFSRAFFPYKHKLLKILTGPMSCEGFLHLNHCISKSISQAEKKIEMVDHKSVWAMNFRDSSHSKCAFGHAETDQSHDKGPSCSAGAARYIAWVLNPISESHQDLLVDSLSKISSSLIFKQFGSDKRNKSTSAHKKRLKKPKFADKEDDCQTISLWLEDFQDIYTKYYNITSHGSGIQKNVLFRKIPLGFLIVSSNYISEQGCELILHYASTGTIYQSTETGKDSITWTESFNREEAVAGARLIFHLTDAVENMSTSIFENEEDGVDFVSHVKLRVFKYLLKCVEKLQFKIGQDADLLMFRDLYNRLMRWRHQGKNVFQGCKDLDDAICAISSKLSSL